MTDVQKNKHIMDKIDAHLRKTARRMVQFDTLDETLHYLIDSFHQQYGCEYMAIIYQEDDVLKLMAKKGHASQFEAYFPLDVSRCHARLLLEPVSSLFDVLDNEEQCPILTGVEEEQFQTWFTIPIRTEEGNSLGLCVIGFRSFVPLVVGAEKLFEEYGKDIAISFQLAQQRENESKKIEGLDWLKENVYLGGTSIEQIVGNIVERAGKGTDAKEAYVYLYDESTNNLLLQPPSYGATNPPKRINMLDAYDLKPFFPRLEKAGSSELTIPLMVKLKLIGILHVNEKLNHDGAFTNEDLELLQFLASHVSTLIENARLYMNEVDRQNRLQTYMQHQQELVKQTIEDEGFAGISNFLSNMLNCSVVMLDRFLHLTSQKYKEQDEERVEEILGQINREKKAILRGGQAEQWLSISKGLEMGLWRVSSGGDTLGYLGLIIPQSRMDLVLRMSLNHALNVCAVQFIKQKLVLDVREQVRDSFFNQLFVEKIQDRKKILEYTNLLNWNIAEPHAIGLFSLEFESVQGHSTNLLEEDAKKTWVWERIRDYMTRVYPDIIFTRKDGYYMVIVPQVTISVGDFWKRFYERVKKMVKYEEAHLSVFIGISQDANRIEDYYLCYKQAQKTLVILRNRFADKGYMSFDELGSYTVLYHLGDPLVVPLFLKTFLNPLLVYGNGKNRDLFDTLRVYLQTNGNIKDAANLLFIHRSSLKYRLERIREIIGIDIDNAEQRFNMMLAYKLYDLFGDENAL